MLVVIVSMLLVIADVVVHEVGAISSLVEIVLLVVSTIIIVEPCV